MVRAVLVALAALVAVLVLRALAADEASAAPAGTPSPPGPAVADRRLDPHRTLEVPDDVRATAWWSGGTRPGGAGPAVVVSQLDSETGPSAKRRTMAS